MAKGSSFAASAIVLAVFMAGDRAMASDNPAAPVYKFTTGYYAMSGGDQASVSGMDFNLRRNLGEGNVWLAWFRSPGMELRQTRAGWDHSFIVGPLRVQPSLQSASGGFWGWRWGKAGLQALDLGVPTYAPMSI